MAVKYWQSFFLGENIMELKEARFRKQKTQFDLRIATGISQTKISLIERGYIQPKPFEVKALARALKVNPKEGLRVGILSRQVGFAVFRKKQISQPFKGVQMWEYVGDSTIPELKTYARNLHFHLITSMSIYCVSTGWTQ
jgi:predicted transcriptional regulator